jgi:DNA-directed RNA polymerase specialized sigma24 family protein
MTDHLTTELQVWIVRLQAGDPAARKELLNRAYPRLHRLAGKLLGESFPRLKTGPASQQTSDITNEVCRRLYQALEEVQPASVLDFFRLAACQVRRVLLDLAKKPALPLEERDLSSQAQAVSCPPGAPDSDELPRPEKWARLHEQVEQLPEEERAVWTCSSTTA